MRPVLQAIQGVSLLCLVLVGCGHGAPERPPEDLEPAVVEVPSEQAPAVEVPAGEVGEAPPDEPAPFGPTENEAIGRRRLVLGDGFSCALLDDQSVVCWGRGIGGADPDRGPRTVEALAGAVEIVGGGGGLCGRDGAGRVRCVGEPASPSPLGALEGATSIAAWGGLVCATLGDGTIRCAGLSSVEAEIAGSIHDALAVHTTFEHVCVTRREHRARCFDAGGDSSSEASEASTNAAAVGDVGGRPCAIHAEGRASCVRRGSFEPPPELVALSGQGARYCALDRRGRASCLSPNDQDSIAFLPVVSPRARALAVAARSERACVLFEGDVVRCTGRDDDGRVSGRAPTPEGIATVVQGPTSVADVAVGAGRAAAVDADGALWTWGAHDAVARRVPTRTRFVAVAGAMGALTALDREGSAYSIRAEGEPQRLRGVRARSLHDGHEHLVVMETLEGGWALMGPSDSPLYPSAVYELVELTGARDVRQTSPNGACGVLAGTLRCVSRGEVEPARVELTGEVARFFGDAHHRAVVLVGGDAFYWGVLDTIAPPSDELRVVGLGSGLPHIEAPVAAPSLGGSGGLWWGASIVRLGEGGAVERLDRSDSFAPTWRPVRGLEGVSVRDVSLSAAEGCALDEGGLVRCWGELARADGQPRDPRQWVTVQVRFEPSASNPR